MKFIDTPEAKRKKKNFPALFLAIAAAVLFCVAAVKAFSGDHHAASLYAGVAVFAGVFHSLAVMVWAKRANQ